MIPYSYVIYQSPEAAADMMEVMELLPNNCINFTNTHYISDETAAANLDLARLRAAMLSSPE